MTLIKSLLLGSAAGVVAVASAQAADLPTRKGPVAAQYVRVCSITVAGAPVVGFVLPGSDTCFKISGYITGQIEGGNLSQGYTTSYVSPNNDVVKTTPTMAKGWTNGAAPAVGVVGNQAINGHAFTAAGASVGATTFNRDSFGYTTRANVSMDAVSNTAYGPLVGHVELQSEFGVGFDTTAVGTYVNRAYVTWAGLTAGRANSFFSFTGGGLGWANFFSPDHQGFNQPDLLAYTANFGGGFSASIAAEMAEVPPNAYGSGEPTGGGSNMGYLGSAAQGGSRIPDIVGALDVKQAWGTAHLGVVAHNVRASSLMGDGATLDKWGWAVDAGVLFNIPGMAGSQIGLTGSWSQNATWYSGIPDGMWGENGAVNGNGQAIAIGDAFANGNGSWATPQAWSITGWANFVLNPQVTLGLEGSYGEVSWSGTLPSSMLSNSRSFIIGGVAHYDPVKNLDFEFELLYQNTQTDQPTGYVVGNGVNTTSSWQGGASGFATRFEVTRSF